MFENVSRSLKYDQTFFLVHKQYKLGYVKGGSTAFKSRRTAVWRLERSEGAIRS